MARASKTPKFSIIIPCRNLVMISRMCIDSVKAYTTNYELIIIDDGSEKETASYLKSVKPTKLIRNEESLGWCKAINQGSKVARGEYIVYLNNDVVVSPGWLDIMADKFKQHGKLGLLSCTTKGVEGFQNIHHNAENLHLQEVRYVMGYCMMFNRDTFEKLYTRDGYWLDERFGLGGQDDVDLSIRVQQLGLKVCIDRDVFIYHYGSATFRQEFNHDVSKSKAYAESRDEILTKKHFKKRMVYICIPNFGNVRIELVKRLLYWYKTSEHDIRFNFLQGALPLDNARSQCVKNFMEISNHPEDRLWFIDADIVPPFNGLDTLMSHDKDVVGLLCFMMKPDDDGQPVPLPIAIRYNSDKKYVVYFDGEGLTEVDALGGGCIMSKRKVFEAIGGRPFEFHYYPDGTLKLVGDYDFCQKVQKAGMKVYVDFNSLCGHVKEIDLKDVSDLMIGVANGR